MARLPASTLMSATDGMRTELVIDRIACDGHLATLPRPIDSGQILSSSAQHVDLSSPSCDLPHPRFWAKEP